MFMRLLKQTHVFSWPSSGTTCQLLTHFLFQGSALKQTPVTEEQSVDMSGRPRIRHCCIATRRWPSPSKWNSAAPRCGTLRGRRPAAPPPRSCRGCAATGNRCAAATIGDSQTSPTLSVGPGAPTDTRCVPARVDK